MKILCLKLDGGNSHDDLLLQKSLKDKLGHFKFGDFLPKWTFNI